MTDIDKEFPDRKDMDEALDEANVAAKENMSELPEAPASANTRVKTSSGRQWQITMRTSSMLKLVQQIQAMDDLFDSKGWVVPNWQKEEKNTPLPIEENRVENNVPVRSQDLGNCRICHAPNKLSMKNKVYCSAKCWLTPKS